MSSIYLFEVGSQKAQWLSARQTAIAGNVANASTPGYHAVDAQPFSTVLDSAPIELATTNPAHLSLPQSEAGELREIEVTSTYMHGQGLMVPVVGRLSVATADDGSPQHLLLVAEDRHTT